MQVKKSSNDFIQVGFCKLLYFMSFSNVYRAQKRFTW